MLAFKKQKQNHKQVHCIYKPSKQEQYKDNKLNFECGALPLSMLVAKKEIAPKLPKTQQ